MEKKLEIMIDHIIEKMGYDCDCRLCHLSENGTFLDGLREALKLIPNRRK